MRVLITGSAGFVGRYFARALQQHDLTCIDLEHGTDIRDWLRTDTTRYDLIVHCAALVGGRRTIDQAPLRLAATDLAIDADLFTWARRHPPGALVYFSSSAAYPVALQTGTPPRRLAETDIDLADLRTPDTSYGWVKLTGEMLAHHAQADGLPVHVVRPFSGYAGDQHPDYPFRAFIDRALRRDDPFVVWGDGGQVRDWIHITDVVDAVLAMLEQGVDGPVNLGWGRPVSFDELAALVTAEIGYSPVIEHRPGEPTGVRYRVADPARLNSFFTPRVTLEEGVHRALRRRVAA